jgi:hypothetical protein
VALRTIFTAVSLGSSCLIRFGKHRQGTGHALVKRNRLSAGFRVIQSRNPHVVAQAVKRAHDAGTTL